MLLGGGSGSRGGDEPCYDAKMFARVLLVLSLLQAAFLYLPSPAWALWLVHFADVEICLLATFTGLGAPYWDPDSRGAILGLTRGTGPGHIARAALEAIALSSAELISAMNRDMGGPLKELRVDGGAAANNLLMQLQADLTGLPVLRPKQTETTALGAAYLAGIGANAWQEDEVADLWQLDRRFEPRMPEPERDRLMAAWQEAVQRVLVGSRR